MGDSQASVAQKADNAIHWINLYPLDSAIAFPNTYALDSDLSGEKWLSSFPKIEASWFMVIIINLVKLKLVWGSNSQSSYV